MTTPDELQRALGWLPGTLDKLGVDDRLDDAARAKALTLASALPATLDDWLALDAAEPVRVSHVLDALEASIKFLTDLDRVHPRLDSTQHRKLRVVLRHQPSLGWFDIWHKLNGQGVAMGSYITRAVDHPVPCGSSLPEPNGAETVGPSSQR